MKLTKKNLNNLYFIILILAGIIFAMPSKYLLSVYTPSYLGWVSIIILIPAIIILFTWVTVLEMKHNDKSTFLKRISMLIIVCLLSFAIKYFLVN
jgi:hypothetical protein